LTIDLEAVLADFVEAMTAGFERDDIELVKLFLGEYRDTNRNSYRLKQRPDTVGRKARAVEAVAVNGQGHRLAIEHTLVEPFEGKKADDVPFLTVFEQLRLDKSLLVPNRFINVQCPALSIPKQIDWKDVGQKVLDWFKDARKKFPAEGQSSHLIPDVGFDLTVNVETMDIPSTEGVVVLSRILPGDKPFIDVLRRSLHKKVPKLVETPAERHILLLEDEGVAIGFHSLIEGIDASAEELADLGDVDEVWVVKTMGWKPSGKVFFCRVWPGGVGERFQVLNMRFAR
jgi:hypothetical protein